MQPREHQANHRVESADHSDARHETNRLQVSNEEMHQHQRVSRPDPTADRTSTWFGHVSIENNTTKMDPNKHRSNVGDAIGQSVAQEFNRPDTRRIEKPSGESTGTKMLRTLEMLDGAYLGRKAAEYVVQHPRIALQAVGTALAGAPGALLIHHMTSIGLKASSESVYGKRR